MTEEKLDQSVCVVYEYSNFDEPVLRRINKPCVWKSDGITARIWSEGVTIREEGILELRHVPFSKATCVVIGPGVKLDDRDKETSKLRSAEVPSQRFLLVLSRRFDRKFYLDGREYVRSGDLDWKRV